MTDREIKLAEINLKKLEYFPYDNPLVDKEFMAPIPIRKKFVRAGVLTKKNTLVAETGEILHEVSYHIRQKEVDDASFVKVYADQIAKTYELSKAAQKVFIEVLRAYEKEPLGVNGYLETVMMWFSDGQLNGETFPYTDRTYHNGLKELLACNIIAPKTPTIFWCNPTVFFRGDRVLFIDEVIRRRGISNQPEQMNALKRRLNK